MSSAPILELIARTRISEVVRALGGPEVKHGRCCASWRDGDNPESVSIDEGRGVWYDHRMQVGGGILDLIQTIRCCSRGEAVQWLADFRSTDLVGRQRSGGGPWRISTAGGSKVPHISRHSALPVAALGAQPEQTARVESALAIWNETTPVPGTLGETYLRGRGLRTEGLDHVVRFHPRCPWSGVRVPALVSLLRDVVTDDPCGVHRVGLDWLGAKLGKKMLGRAKAAAVKLSPDEEVTMGLGICEGVETGLAILQKGFAPVWAALSASGISTFPVLRGIEALTVFADADDAGLTNARACANRWNEAGIRPTVRAPAADGADFNDLVVAR